MPDDDSSSAAPEIGTDAITAALVNAFRSKSVDVDDGVTVTAADGLYHLAIRLSKRATPLPAVPDDTSDLAPGSVEGAAMLILGTVQLIATATRVTMRIVNVETSEILESSKGDADGVTEESVGDAAEDAISELPTLSS
jgi:hypothetical protein